MRSILPLFVVAVLLASCSTPDAARRVAQVTPPRQVEAIAGKVQDVSTSAQAVDRSNRELQRRVADLNAASREASTAASRAESEVDRLALQKAATEDELLNLQVIMRDVAQRNMFLETSVQDLETKIVEQEEHIVKLSQSVMTAQAAAAEKDQEVVLLRDDLRDANDRIKDADERIQHYSKSAQREAEKAASAKTYRNIVIAVAVGGLLWLLVPVIIRAVKPL